MEGSKFCNMLEETFSYVAWKGKAKKKDWTNILSDAASFQICNFEDKNKNYNKTLQWACANFCSNNFSNFVNSLGHP